MLSAPTKSHLNNNNKINQQTEGRLAGKLQFPSNYGNVRKLSSPAGPDAIRFGSGLWEGGTVNSFYPGSTRALLADPIRPGAWAGATTLQQRGIGGKSLKKVTPAG